MMRVRLGEEREPCRATSRCSCVTTARRRPPPPMPMRTPRVWRMVNVPDAEYYELRNHGAREAAGAVLVFLDSDVIPEPG